MPFNLELINKLELQFHKNIPENSGRMPNDPWILHKGSAILDNQEIGYLRVSYISKDKLNKTWPDIWSFVENKMGFPLKGARKTEDIYNVLIGYWHRKNNATSKEKLKAINDWLAYHNANKQFRDVKHIFVDQPFIDYIFVEEKFRRNGIGTKLYSFVGRELAKMNLTLRASTLQSNDAMACWEYMELHEFPIKRENGKKFLDYRDKV